MLEEKINNFDVSVLDKIETIESSENLTVDIDSLLNTGRLTEFDVFRFLVKDENNTSQEHIAQIQDNVSLFLQVIPQNGINGVYVFDREYAIIYEILKLSHSVGGVLTLKIFYNLLIRNIESLVKKLNINLYQITKQKDTEQQLKSFAKMCLEEYVRLSLADKTGDFKQIFSLYLEELRERLYDEVLLFCAEIRKVGKKIGNKEWKGLLASQEFYDIQMGFINSLYIDHAGAGVLETSPEGLTVYKKLLTQNSFKPVVTFGMKEIDSIIGPLCTCQLVTLMGDTGGGKSRNAIHLSYRAVMQGKNVLFFSLEEPQVAVINKFIAKHIYERTSSLGRPVIVDPKRISEGSLTEQEKSQVNEAMYDLFLNSSYGKLRVEKGPLYVENFTDVIKGIYREWGRIDMIVIDYPGLMQSLTGKKPTEIVMEAYIKFKNLISNELGEGALGIAISQMTRESIKESYNIVEEGKGEIGTTGARMSQEVTNSSDIVIAIVSTPELRRNKQIQYFHVKGRDSITFAPFTAKALFQVCSFTSVWKEEEGGNDI